MILDRSVQVSQLPTITSDLQNIYTDIDLSARAGVATYLYCFFSIFDSTLFLSIISKHYNKHILTTQASISMIQDVTLLFTRKAKSTKKRPKMIEAAAEARGGDEGSVHDWAGSFRLHL